MYMFSLELVIEDDDLLWIFLFFRFFRKQENKLLDEMGIIDVMRSFIEEHMLKTHLDFCFL